MTESQTEPQELLVAVDFSPNSLRALTTALRWRHATAEITVLHVVDRVLVERIESLGLGRADEVLAQMRYRAEEEMARLLIERGGERVESMIVVGEPFVEIVKIANDLDCDLIVLGIRSGANQLKQLLFGGTAEQVLRAASRPVLCVP
ncbi:MAG: universal stress protein [Candidatus Binatia bacterium]